MKKHNFNAGPSILAQKVLLEASEAVVDLNNTGLSILEISHRSEEFQAIIEETRTLIKEMYSLPSSYDVLLLQGGASTQFYMVAMNLLGQNESAGYVDTGNWSLKAISEANSFGHLKLLASSKDKDYSYIPKNFTIPEGLKYIHLTSNNTIRGTQFQSFPNSETMLVADMSSDILSRSIEISKFGLIYAGAQKNLGPAGVTLVIVNKEFVSKTVREIPTMLNYNTHISKGSMFNTPPVFSIYTSMLTLRRMKEKGGLSYFEKKNKEKAELLYDTIDSSNLFYCTAVPEDRSHMNVTFLMRKKEFEKEFVEACNEAGCVGIKGHRSVGGFRASIYNAMELESVQVLADVINFMDQKYG